MPPPSPTAAGVGFAVAAYSIWGFVPIYWKWVGAVPASEVLIPRILWTALLMLGAAPPLFVANRLGPPLARHFT